MRTKYCFVMFCFQSDDLREKIGRLKMAHAELTMNCSGVRTKIEGARLEEKQL